MGDKKRTLRNESRTYPLTYWTGKTLRSGEDLAWPGFPSEASQWKKIKKLLQGTGYGKK